MSEPARLTFSDLLPKEVEGLGAEIKKHVGEQSGAVAWPLVEDRALEGLRKALSGIDLCEQLAQAWVTVAALRAYRDPKHTAGGEAAVVPLGQHHLSLKASPALQLTFGGWKAPPLKLSYAVTAAFDNASLSIAEGALVAVAPGDCATTVILSCGAVPLHAPWTLAHLNLPGRLSFTPGWKIP